MKIISKLLLSFLLIFSHSIVNAKNQNQNVILILDASGSMWGQINGKAKIDIARASIAKLLTNWDSNAKMGIMVYGHRTKGDCNDIQMLKSIGRVNKSNIMSILTDLNPKGKTPLSSSIIRAAEILKSKEDAATVILVSDGLETCGMDPCAVAKQLKKENINFKAHVIGFGLKNFGDTSKLSCIAASTGGKYYSADNAEQLNKAFTVIRKVVIQSSIKIKINSSSSDRRWVPADCDNMRTMHISKKVTLSSSLHKCTKLIVKSGGWLKYDVTGEPTTVIIVEKGGVLWSEENVYAIVNQGGDVKITDGDINILHAGSGKTLISPEAEFKKQSGKSEVELTKIFAK